MESMMTVACPICGKKMQRVGNGTACENCGHISIASPMEETFKKNKRNKLIKKIVIWLLILYVIPNIILMFLK